MGRSQGVYLPSKLFDSGSYKSLTKAQMRIFYEFMLKRKFASRKRKGLPSVLNNGNITFSYGEAEKLGYPRHTFRRAIDKMVEVGLIDITRQGQGGCVLKDGTIIGEYSLYGLSERWEKYDTEDFVKKKRKKDNRKGRGWAVYHARKNKTK